MDYHAGDTVMHWVHGLGKVIRREKRDVLGHQALYYAVHVGNMIVWVPVDDKVSQRLRPPTGKIRFKRIVALLSTPGEPLPSDRHERKLLLSEYLMDGSLEFIGADHTRPAGLPESALAERQRSGRDAQGAVRAAGRMGVRSIHHAGGGADSVAGSACIGVRRSWRKPPCLTKK